MAKGRKSVLRNAKLLSVYLDEEFTEKLEYLSSQTLVPKAALVYIYPIPYFFAN